MKELLLKRKARFALYLIACFISATYNLLVDLGLAILIGSIEIGTMDYFIKTVLISIGIIIISTILYLVSRFMRISFMRDTILDVRLNAFDKILKTSYKNFSMKSKDSYISNLINDINLFENGFFMQLLNIIVNGGLYFTALIIIAFMDVKFAIIALVSSVVLFLVSKSFEKKTVSLQEEVSEHNEDFAIDVSNTFNGLEILKLNNIEEKFLSKSFESITKLEKKKFAYNVYTDGQRKIMDFLGFGFLIGSMIYLSTLIGKGMTITKVVLMVQLSNRVIWNIIRILPLFNQLKASINIYNKITKPDEEVDSNIVKEKDFLFEQDIEVKNLSFDYDGKEIFNNVSFKIEKNKKYLLKGASGSGKSTLIKLLSMVYEDYSGEIIVDGVNYRDIKEEKINDKVSFIYQDVFLFEDTIFNNISLFKPFSEQKVLDAAKKAGLEGLLSSKEDGINEMLMENGKNLSGGERQRISIARAIVKDSQILFADEATSSLDQDLGMKVEDTILSIEGTVIAISHRYYEGITERYDYVLEIVDGQINQYKANEYFMEVAI